MDTFAGIKHALDPILTSVGFTAGQGAEDGTDGQMTWCAAFSDFAPAFPWLPQSVLQHEPAGHECVDLIVELSLDSLADVTLEFIPLDETLRAIGRGSDAETVTALLGRPAGTLGAQLAPIVRRLLEPPPTGSPRVE